VAHLDGLGDTPVCCGTPVAHHCIISLKTASVQQPVVDSYSNDQGSAAAI
jgi:hypothetical protein